MYFITEIVTININVEMTKMTSSCLGDVPGLRIERAK